MDELGTGFALAPVWCSDETEVGMHPLAAVESNVGTNVCGNGR
jgi:hypothetical protein